MKVLITGGAGFIGSHLALKLKAKGYEVVIMDNLSPQIHGDNPELTSPIYKSIYKEVDFINGDVCNQQDWSKALQGINIIVHYAAETGTGQSMYEIEKYSAVNIGGTSIMLQLLANSKHTVQKVIIASSRAIYGEGKYYSDKYGIVYPVARTFPDLSKGDFEVKFKDDLLPLQLMATDEDSKIHPASVYGITKQTQEQLVLCVCNSLKIPAVALRYQNVYGPGQSLTNPYTGILSIFSSIIKKGNSIDIYEDGTESRDFVFIDDVVDATILSIENENANNQVFNVGTGVATSVKTVAETLIKLYNKKIEVKISGNFRLGDIRHNYADLTKIKSLLGFEPKVNFDTGIRKFADWVIMQ